MSWLGLWLISTLACHAHMPNVLLILADDLGYGDVRAYQPASQIPTPHIDQLAHQGVRFTDAHTPSSVCTPTRYGLLTGRYAWRTSLKRGVLNGYSPPLMDARRLTLPRFLKGHGYQTAMVGKWHLGLHYAKLPAGRSPWPEGEIDFHQPVTRGPNDFGFEESFIIPASLDFPPYVYLKNQQITAPPDRLQPQSPFPAYLREGPIGQDFVMNLALDRMMDEAISFLERQQGSADPFFLYVALSSPHKPVLPHPRYVGSTSLGPYGDFVVQTDAAVGRLLTTLKTTGKFQETMVIFTSDNGSFMKRAENTDHVEDSSVQGYRPAHHLSNGPWRGTKADIWEGGHRVPFLIRYPPLIQAGSICGRTICLTDVFATIAALIERPIPEGEGQDSHTFAALLNQANADHVRPPVVHHSAAGMFAIRSGPWKLVLGNGSGGRELPRGKDFSRPYALFDLSNDPSESMNLASRYPEKVKELEQVLQGIRKQP